MRGCELRSGVHWQGVLKQKGIQQGLHVLLKQLLLQVWVENAENSYSERWSHRKF